MHVRLPSWFSVAATFLLITLLWVPFRAGSLGATKRMVYSLAGLNGVDTEGFTSAQCALLGLGALLVWTLPTTAQWLEKGTRNSSCSDFVPKWWHWKPTFFWGVYVGMLALAGIAMLTDTQEFIYFQF